MLVTCVAENRQWLKVNSWSRSIVVPYGSYNIYFNMGGVNQDVESEIMGLKIMESGN